MPKTSPEVLTVTTPVKRRSQLELRNVTRSPITLENLFTEHSDPSSNNATLKTYRTFSNEYLSVNDHGRLTISVNCGNMQRVNTVILIN